MELAPILGKVRRVFILIRGRFFRGRSRVVEFRCKCHAFQNTRQLLQCDSCRADAREPQFFTILLAAALLLPPQGDTVEQLLPLFLSLLKDEWPDVRLAIIGKLQAVNQVWPAGPVAGLSWPAVLGLADPAASVEAWQGSVTPDPLLFLHTPRPVPCRSSASSCWPRRCCLRWRTWPQTSTGACGRPSSSTRPCWRRRWAGFGGRA